MKIYLVLDNIRSRENVGSIFRTADAAGVKKIFLCGITPTPDDDNPSNPSGSSSKLSKTALGAEKWVSWEYRRNTWQVLRELKAKNSKIKVFGLEQASKSKNIFMFGFTTSKHTALALVVGNEVKGISPQILKYCDKIIHIPMYGRKESLNVSVATGVALYALLNPK